MSSLPINTSLGIPQLDVNGKILVDQLPNSIMEYKGTWNAATNTPTLVNGTGNQGDVYLCNVAGTVDFGAGPIVFFVGDQVIYSGTIWQRASGASGTVTSVAVTESGDALTITGSPITTSGTINIGFAGNSGQYVNGAGGLTTFPSLTGFVPYTGATANVDLGIYDIKTAGTQLKDGQSFTPTLGYTSLSSVSSGVLGILGLTFDNNAGGATLQFTRNVFNTYTFPNASGTLALTSNLSSYVPYTGATGSVDLGVNTLTALGVLANNFSAIGNTNPSGNGGYIFLKQGIGPFTNDTGYNSITANSTRFLLQANVDASNNKSALLELGSLTNNTTRTFTLPDLSGTLALLEGTQTFTGSKTFSNTTLVNTIYIDGVSYLKHLTSTSYITGYTTYSAKANGVIEYFFPSSFKSVLDFNDAADYTYTFPASSGTIALTNNIPSITGLVPYTGATTNVNLGTFDLTADVITGATGSFASSGGSDTFAINHSSGSGIALNITKGGNGEGLVINKTSGSGNALSVTGSTSLGTLTGTSATFSSDILVSGVRVGTGSGGTNNTRVGALSFMSNTTGGYNTAIGSSSLNLNTTGSNNTAVGNGSLQQNTTGDANTAVGLNSLVNNTTGFNNTAIGYSVLGNSTTASNNVAIGYGSGVNISTGSNNTLITGGGSITTGSNNTIIGNYAGTTTLANNIVLADGQGNIRYQWNGTNNVFTGAATFSSSVSGTSIRSSAVGSFGFNTANNGEFQIYATASDGMIMAGRGSSNDMVITNKNGNDVFRIPTGTTIANFVGNVGIGTDSPSVTLDTFLNTGTGYQLVARFLGGTNANGNAGGIALGSTQTIAGYIYGLQTASNGGDLVFGTQSSGAYAERMRITSGGKVYINTTTDLPGSGTIFHVYANDACVAFANNSSGQQVLLLWNKATSGNNLFQEFATETGITGRGSIDFNRAAGLVRYNTTSDANLKNIIGDSNLEKSINILNTTKIKEFSWKEDETNKVQIGVIAQELYETYKGAVSVGSDEELLGTEDYKSWKVDKTAFTFHLIAGWQKHEQIINDLQAQIDELKQIVATK
jgi:hypothetical protein